MERPNQSPHSVRGHRELAAETYRKITGIALLVLVFIVATGAAVRLTESGLGCSDWPQCEEGKLLPELSFHPLIEFVNRLITGLVAAGVIAAVAGAIRRTPRRRDLIALSWALVAGVVAQIVLGALLVREELDPRFTMGHYLLSAVLVGCAVVLWHRAEPEDRPPRRHDRASAPVRNVCLAALVAASVVQVVGAVVTGTGPHGGDAEADRFDLTLSTVVRIHGATAWVLVALLVCAAVLAHGDTALRPSLQLALGLTLAQGALGYTQYALALPAGLVLAHVIGAMLTWAAIVHLALEANLRAGTRSTPDQDRYAEPVLSRT